MPIDPPNLPPPLDDAFGADRAGEAPSADDAADPAALLGFARAQFAAGRAREALTTLLRVIIVAPAQAGSIISLAGELRREGNVDGAFGCVEVLADAALLDGELARAAMLLSEFVEDGVHLPALTRLVEVCRDAGDEHAMRRAQAQLVDVYLSEGRGADARPVAEELLAFAPDSEEHAVRLRTVLAMLGVDDVDLVVGLVRAGHPGASLRVLEGEALEDGFVGPAVEIDLSERVDGLAGEAATDDGTSPAKTAGRDVEAVFADLRAAASEHEDAADAAQRYERALVHLKNGRVAEGVLDLQSAVRSPLMRFSAASRLGRLHRDQGDVPGSVEWLERAAEAPPPTPEEGYAVLYDLADSLERMGESDRAVAVLVELEATQSGYRDVAERLRRLSGLPSEGDGS